MNGRQIEKELFALKMKEKPNTISGRMNIISYELGYAIRSVLYSLRFPKDKNIHMKQAELELADTIIQLNMLCIELGLDFDNLREKGLLHLSERYDDFEHNRWKEMK